MKLAQCNHETNSLLSKQKPPLGAVFVWMFYTIFMKKHYIFWVILVIFVTLLFIHIKNEKTLLFSIKGTLGGQELLLAIADTADEHKKGLSGQLLLPENRGLLFIFDHSSMYGIWMKNMLFAIDVLWLDENYRVISVREQFTPSSYPETAYPSASARYVLELPAGFVEKHKINIGEVLHL